MPLTSNKFNLSFEIQNIFETSNLKYNEYV